jgi:hypothetical protein
MEDQTIVQTPTQTPPDNAVKYYNYLKANGADVPPTYDSFQKTLSDQASAQKYYTYLKSNNFDAPPTYDSFQRTLGLNNSSATSNNDTQVQQLYGQLTNTGHNMGTYGQFVANMQNPIAANKLYTGLMAAGGDLNKLGSIVNFRQQFANLTPQPPANTTNQPANINGLSTFTNQPQSIINSPVIDPATRNQLIVQAQQAQKNQQAQPAQQIKTGFRPVALNIPEAPAPVAPIVDDESSTNPTEVAQRQSDESQQQYENAHPGSWSNTIPLINHILTETATKPLASIATMTRDLIGATSSTPTNASTPLYKDVPIYNKDGSLIGTNSQLTDYGNKVQSGQISDPLAKFATTLDAYNNITDQKDQTNTLPHTFLGNTATGVLNLAPDVAVASMFPEAELADDAGSISRLKSAVFSPFANYMATKGVVQGYSVAKQKGASPLDAVKQALVSGGIQGAQAASFMMLGGIGGKLSDQAFSGLDKLGLVSNSGAAITKAGLDASIDAGIFSLYPVASNMLAGKSTSPDEMEQNAGMGLLFGGIKGLNTIGDYAKSASDVNSIVTDRQAIAMQNFMNADMDAITQAHNLPGDASDLNAKAVEEAYKAKQANQIEDKNKYIASASILAKTGDVKSVTEAILNDRNGFVQSIQNSDLQPDEKQLMIAKINATYKELDPVEQQKTALGNQISQIDNTLNNLKGANITDPVQQAEADVTAENLNNQRDTLNDNLKELIRQQQRPQPQDEPGQPLQPISYYASTPEELKANQDITDAKVEQFQKNFPDHSVDMLDDLPDHVVRTFDRVDNNLPTDPVAINEASDWLYNKYKQLSAMKLSDTRMLTVPQIESMQSQLGDDITKLENNKAINNGETDQTQPETTVNPGTVSIADKAEIRQQIADSAPANNIHTPAIHVFDTDGNLHNEAPAEGVQTYDEQGNLENKQIDLPTAKDVIERGQQSAELGGENDSKSASIEDNSNIIGGQVNDNLSHQELDEKTMYKTGRRVDADTNVSPLSSTSETSSPDANIPKFSSPQEAYKYWIENENNPNAIAARYHTDDTSQPDYIEKGIMDYLGNSKINQSDYERYGDRNNLDAAKKRRWIDSKNSDRTDLAMHAEILSHELGVQVTPNDFIETIDRYSGRKNFEEANKSDTQQLLEQKYHELTGRNLTAKRAQDAWNKQHPFDAEAVPDYPKTITRETGLTPEDFKNYHEKFDQPTNQSTEREREDGNTANVRGATNDGSGNEQSGSSSAGVDTQEQSGQNTEAFQETKPIQATGEQSAEPVNNERSTETGDKQFNSKSKPQGNEQDIKAGDPLRRLADKIEAGKISKLGGFRASTGFDAIWDASLSAVAESLRGGAKLVDAIESGLKYIRSTDWYKNLTDKADFESKYSDHLTKEYQVEESTSEDDKEPIGISKSAVAEERAQRGLSDLPEAEQTTLKEMFNAGRQAIADGEVDPRKLSVQISETPRNLSSTEVNALLSDRRSLYDEYDKVRDLINQSTIDDNPLTQKTFTDRLKYVEQQLDLNEQALRKGSRENSLALVSMQNMINSDYSLASQMSRMCSAAGGELTPDMAAEVEKYHKELAQAKKELDDFRKAETERLAKTAVDNEKLSQRKSKKAVVKADLKAERKSIVDDYLAELAKIRKSGNLLSDIPYRRELAAAVPFMKKMLTNLVKDGVVEFNDVIGTIHDEFSKHIDGLSKRDVLDVLAGKHDERKETENDLWKQRKAITRLSKLTGDLEDLKKGIETETSEKRLVQKRADIAKLEDEIKEMHKAARTESLPERQRESYIKKLNNDIAHLDEQINSGEKENDKREDKYKDDTQIQQLRDLRSSKVDELNDVDPRQAEAAKLSQAIKTVEQSISDYQKKIADNDLHPAKEVNDYQSPVLDALKQKRDELSKQYQQLKKDEFTPEQRLQQSLKKRLDLLNKRIADKDFAPPPQKTKVDIPTAKTISLQAKVKRAENNFDAMAQRLNEHSKSKFEKGLSTYRKINLAVILSGTKVLSKLYGFGLAKRITNPMDELANTLNAHTPLLKNIINRSPRYAGGINFHSEAKAISARWNRATLNDVWESAKTGTGELEHLYGKSGVDKDFELNSSILDFFQHIHSAVKTPTKRAEFFRSMVHRLSFAAKQGEDISDPDVQFKAGLQAYADSKRAILMNDNMLSDKFYKAGIQSLERSKDNSPKALAAFIRAVFPVTKVPTNYALNAWDRLTGAVPGLSRATPLVWKAIADGAESLSDEQADSIARILSKGQVGLAMMAMAYFLPNLIKTGGYYTGKRKDTDLKPGDVIVGGVSIPHALTHNDVIEAMQFSSTVKRAIDYGKEKQDGTGALLGVGQGLKGIAEQIPFIDSRYTSDLTSPNKALNTAGTFLKNKTEPVLMQEIAQATDKDDSLNFAQHPVDYLMGPTRQRNPQTIGEYLKTGIPGLRETVQQKPYGTLQGPADQVQDANDFLKENGFKVNQFKEPTIGYQVAAIGKAGNKIYLPGKIPITPAQQNEIDKLKDQYMLKYLNGTTADSNGNQVPTIQYLKQKNIPAQIKLILKSENDNALQQAKQQFLKENPDLKNKVIPAD